LAMDCLSCGFENPDGFVYCGRCGRRIGEDPSGALQEAEEEIRVYDETCGGSTSQHDEDLSELNRAYSEAGWMMRYFIIWQLIPVYVVLATKGFLGDCRSIRAQIITGSPLQRPFLDEKSTRMRPPIRP